MTILTGTEADDKLITLQAAARMFPSARADGAIHVSTVLRWARRGVRGIRLQATRTGLNWFTTRRALAEFVKQMTESSLEPNAAKHVAGPDESAEAARRRASNALAAAKRRTNRSKK